MKRLAGAGVILAVAACMGPRPDAPPASRVVAPTGWHASSDGGPALVQEWWQAFGDPVLTQLVELALVHNQDVAIAITRVSQARAEQRLARAPLLPSVGIHALGARERDVGPFGEPEQQTDGEGLVEVAYDADLFGRLKDLNAAARASLLASEGARDTVMLGVSAAVASAYINLRAFDARLTTARDTLNARAGALTYARRRANAGYTSVLELSQAQAEYDSTLALIPMAELAVTKSENALTLLLGDTPSSVARGVAIDALSVPPVPGALPADVLRQRPDLFAAEQQVVAADQSLDAARAAFLPDLKLTGSGGAAYSTLIITNPLTLWSIGGSVLAPLFEGGQLHAAADRAAALRDQAAFQYRKTALTAFREVEDALAGARSTDQEVAALAKQRDSLAQTLKIATNRYQAGYSPYLDQLDAERGLLNAELSLIQARADHLNAYVDLYRTMGGAWRIHD